MLFLERFASERETLLLLIIRNFINRLKGRGAIFLFLHLGLRIADVGTRLLLLPPPPAFDKPIDSRVLLRGH